MLAADTFGIHTSLPWQQGSVWGSRITPWNWPVPKTRARCCPARRISYTRRFMANFVLKLSSFRCHGNKGRSEENFINTVTMAVPENTRFLQESWTYLLYKPSYSKFYLGISKFSSPCQQGLVQRKFWWQC